MCVLRTFSDSLEFYLTNTTNLEHCLIKFHNKRLQKLGDISFTLRSVKGLKLSECRLKKLAENKLEREEFIKELLQENDNWVLKISNVVWINDNCHFFFDKTSTFYTIISKVFNEKEKYGCHSKFSEYKFVFEVPFDGDIGDKNLCELRIFVFRNALNNILNFTTKGTLKNDEKKVLKIKLVCNKKEKVNEEIEILCGPVLGKKDSKKLAVTTSEFHSKRAIDVRLMAEHKYGLRITKNWQELFCKLGEAAAIVELLQNKINQATIVDLNDHTISSSKGASFILYNCGRLSTLFKHFENKVKENVYPPLTNCINDVDFSLLTEPEEWELLYAYVSRFPKVVERSVENLFDGLINIHHLCSFLSNMCSVFSVYYSRVRILIESRNHLFPVLFARLYLLKGVECVLHNGLNLLSIQPVKQM